MGLLGRQTVIAKCPACQASTKVSTHPDKPSIRCPRCQATVPLAYARKYGDEKPAQESGRNTLKQDISSRDYGTELPIAHENQRSSSSSKQRQRRFSSETGTIFNYPDHAVNFVRYTIIATALIVVLSILGIGYLFWQESIHSRTQEYLSNIKDSREQYRLAIAYLKKKLDPLEGSEAEKNYRDAKGKIEYFSTRRRHMTAPDNEIEEVKELLTDLAKLEKELTTLEEETNRLAKQIETKPERKESDSVAYHVGWSTINGPATPSPAQPAPRKMADDKSVIINLPGVNKEEWSEDFSKRFSLLADDGAGKVTVHWAGDLLTLEVRPVIDPARYATKINFGRLLYYSRNERIITLEFKPDKVNNYKAQGDFITPILLDLKQRDKTPKLQSALSQLGNLKVDPSRQAEVAAVLETIAIDTSLEPTLRSTAIKMIPSWSGKESADLLIRVMDDKSSTVRISAIDALVETRAPTAGQALVTKWDKFDAGQISTALIALGPEVEKAVLPVLNNTNNIVLKSEACRVLQEVGTTESLKPLLDLMSVKDQSPLVVDSAKNAMKRILDRKTK